MVYLYEPHFQKQMVLQVIILHLMQLLQLEEGEDMHPDTHLVATTVQVDQGQQIQVLHLKEVVAVEAQGMVMALVEVVGVVLEMVQMVLQMWEEMVEMAHQVPSAAAPQHMAQEAEAATAIQIILQLRELPTRVMERVAVAEPRRLMRMAPREVLVLL